MEHKRLTLFAGHYGSGKTNIAVNYALLLAAEGKQVCIADLDIVNPYFRTKDSAKVLDQAGVELISPQFANTNVDLPALPAESYRLVQDKSVYGIMDIGGDDRGAYALGRFAPSILAEGDYRMIFVANSYRPLTRTPEEALEVMREIEVACGLRPAVYRHCQQCQPGYGNHSRNPAECGSLHGKAQPAQRPAHLCPHCGSECGKGCGRQTLSRNFPATAGKIF